MVPSMGGRQGKGHLTVGDPWRFLDRGPQKTTGPNDPPNLMVYYGLLWFIIIFLHMAVGMDPEIRCIHMISLDVRLTSIGPLVLQGETQSKSQMDQFAGSISGFNDLKVPLYLEDDHH